MKYIILLFALFALTRADDADDNLIWKANYEEFDTQFEKWQSTTSNPYPDIIEDGTVLHFNSDPTHYNGIVT